MIARNQRYRATTSAAAATAAHDSDSDDDDGQTGTRSNVLVEEKLGTKNVPKAEKRQQRETEQQLREKRVYVLSIGFICLRIFFLSVTFNPYCQTSIEKLFYTDSSYSMYGRCTYGQIAYHDFNVIPVMRNAFKKV